MPSNRFLFDIGFGEDCSFYLDFGKEKLYGVSTATWNCKPPTKVVCSVISGLRRRSKANTEVRSAESPLGSSRLALFQRLTTIEAKDLHAQRGYK